MSDGGRSNKKTESTELMMAGHLKKRSPKSLLGVPLWQKRFFQLRCNRKTHHYKLLYYKSEGGKLLGSIPLHLVEKIQLNNKKDGSKFEIIVYGGKIFSLEASGEADGQRWYTALSKALDEEKEYASPLDLRPTPCRNAAGGGEVNNAAGDGGNVKKYWKASGDAGKQKSTLDEILATVEPAESVGGGGIGDIGEDSEFLWESEGSDDGGNSDNEENKGGGNKRRSNDIIPAEPSPISHPHNERPIEAAPSNERKSGGGAGRARFVSYMVDDGGDDDSHSEEENKQRLRKKKSGDNDEPSEKESEHNKNNAENLAKSVLNDNEKSVSSVSRISVASESEDEHFNQNTAPSLPLTGTKIAISDQMGQSAMDNISPRTLVQSLDEVPESWIDQTTDPPKKTSSAAKESEKSHTSRPNNNNQNDLIEPQQTPKLSPRPSLSRPIKGTNEKTAIRVNDSSAITPIPALATSSLSIMNSENTINSNTTLSNQSEHSISRISNNQKIITPHPSSATFSDSKTDSASKSKCCQRCIIM